MGEGRPEPQMRMSAAEFRAHQQMAGGTGDLRKIRTHLAPPVAVAPPERRPQRWVPPPSAPRHPIGGCMARAVGRDRVAVQAACPTDQAIRLGDGGRLTIVTTHMTAADARLLARQLLSAAGDAT